MVFQWQASISDSEGSLLSGTSTFALDALLAIILIILLPWYNESCVNVHTVIGFGHCNAPILNRCFGSINFCYSRILLIVEIVAVVLIIANLHVYH